MKITQGTTTNNKSISITTEGKHIMEFIHIYDRNGNHIGMLSIFNSHSGDTKVQYEEV